MSGAFMNQFSWIRKSLLWFMKTYCSSFYSNVFNFSLENSFYLQNWPIKRKVSVYSILVLNQHHVVSVSIDSL